MRSIQEWKDEKFESSTGLNPKAIRTLTEDLDGGMGMDSGPEMSKLGLRQVMGGPGIKIDSKIRSALRPKLMQVISDHPDIPPTEMLRHIIAVSGALLGDIGGTNFTTNRLHKGLNGDS